MNRRMAFLSLLLLAGGLYAAPRPKQAVRDAPLQSEVPANLFEVSEPLGFTLDHEPPPDAQYKVLDYDGKEAAKGRMKGRAVKLDALPPGYYELVVTEGGGESRAAFAVMPEGNPCPKESRVAIDAAMTITYDKERQRIGAKLLGRIGVGWVRERCKWGRMNPADGRWDFEPYEALADACRDAGVSILMNYADAPAWTLSAVRRGRNPEDLRTVYRFAREAGAHFKGRIQAWEIWNEPNLHFFPHPADQFAGIVKAASLGSLDAGADLKVAACGLCSEITPFARNLFECGVADSFDIFSFHRHQMVKHDMHYLEGTPYHQLMVEYGFAGHPAWITEAGVSLAVDKEGDGELSPGDQRVQADFVARSIPFSLAGGTDMHFFFILPFFAENRDVQWGLLHSDMTPTPGMAAFASTVRMLGACRYLGRVKHPDKHFHAYAFDNGKEPVVVAWAKKETAWEVPAGKSFAVRDAVGRTLKHKPSHRVRVAVGPSPRFMTGVPIKELGELVPCHRAPGRVLERTPPRFVVRGAPAKLPHETEGRGPTSYFVKEGQSFPYAIDCYNFDPEHPLEGRLSIELPKGWKTETAGWTVTVDPMGRHRFEIEIRAGPLGAEPVRVRVSGEADGKPIAPSVSWFLPGKQPDAKQ